MHQFPHAKKSQGKGTPPQTNKQTDIATLWSNRPSGPIWWKLYLSAGIYFSLSAEYVNTFCHIYKEGIHGYSSKEGISGYSNLVFTVMDFLISGAIKILYLFFGIFLHFEKNECGSPAGSRPFLMNYKKRKNQYV